MGSSKALDFKIMFALRIEVVVGRDDITDKQQLIDFALKNFSGHKHVDEEGWIFSGKYPDLAGLRKLETILRVNDNLIALRNHIGFYNLPLSAPRRDCRPYIILESGVGKEARFHEIELSFDNRQRRWKFYWPYKLFL